MGFVNLVTILAFVACLNSAFSSVHIQLDEVAIRNGLPECRFRWRSEATNKRTALFFAGDTLNFPICLPTPARVTIKDFRYSNDGWVDNITFALDDKIFGSILSTDMSFEGELWNVFENTGEVGTVYLPAGEHTFSVTVDSADKWGIEYDDIVLEIGDYLTADDIRCPEEDDGKYIDDKYNVDPAEYKCAPDPDEPIKVMPASPSPDSATPRGGGGDPNEPNNGNSATPRTGGEDPYDPNNGNSATPSTGGGDPNELNNGNSASPRTGGDPYDPNNGNSATPRTGGDPNEPNNGNSATPRTGGDPNEPNNGNSATPSTGGGDPNEPNNGNSVSPRTGGDPYKPNNGNSATPRSGGDPYEPNNGNSATPRTGGDPNEPNNGNSATPRTGGDPNEPNNGNSATPRTGGDPNEPNNGNSATPGTGGGDPPTGTSSNSSLYLSPPGDEDITVNRTGGANFCNNGLANYNIISTQTTQITLSVTTVTSTSFSLPSSLGLALNPSVLYSDSYSYIQAYPSHGGDGANDNMWVEMGDKPRVPCVAMQFSSPDPDGNMTSRFLMRSDGSFLMFPDKAASSQAVFYPPLSTAAPGVGIASVDMKSNGSDFNMDLETESGKARLGVSFGAASTGITFYSGVSILNTNLLSTMVLPCENKETLSNAFIAADGTEPVSLFDSYVKSVQGNSLQIMMQGD